ncbi:phytoene desaturase family protein [Granulicoccus sp. GXG6511]|uniref:phytoene desaturase family protein n=1 Tax=Granulicoccus sp. GXG6511 TaxID=3381351 RepID=UPI003D7D8359
MGQVVVIGAGLAGLAASCHLLAAGHRVVVVERAPIPGGRAGRLVRGEFVFDTGPTVFTMPELLAEPFAAVGADLADRLTLNRLDPAYRARFADGSTLHVRHGHEAMREEIARECSAADAAAYDDFVTWLEQLYHLEIPHFIDRNFDSAAGLLANPGAAARLVRMGGFGRLGPLLRRRFRDPRLHRLFGFQAMYAGLAPDDALAIYAVITYMDSVRGVYFPEPAAGSSGMHAIPAALAGAAADAGAEVVLDAEVRRVLTRSDGAACGVELADGTKINADAVVCTLDLPTAYATLLRDLPRPRALRRPAYSPSAVVWHVGVRDTPTPGIAHHNIHFGAAWSDAFDDLLDGGRLMRDPSRLVCVPSLDDPHAAPEGSSTLYVLEPVPNLAVGTVDWARERPALRERLHAFLDAEGYPSDVAVEELVGPEEWAAQGMAAGTPFALAHTFAQTGPFRPGNVTRHLPGLVFAGSGTVPGVGVPMVLISGKLAAARVREYLR